MPAILDDLGLNITRSEPVHGGDINLSFCLYGQGKKYFLKVNEASRYPGMFGIEANGLRALSNCLSGLQNSTILKVPKAIKNGIVHQQQYLLLEWLEPGRPLAGFWENFGAALAQLHKQPQSYFGWEDDNYIGSLTQINTRRDSWPLFYTDCRIMPLVKNLVDAGIFTKQDFGAAELFCKKSKLFPNEPPSLLHGDLWSGNFMTVADGYAAIYDPAVYYGHREMDLGMTKLFGGFDQRFYNAYDEVYPLEKDWLKRLPLTQLYPLLVHAVLFGGHYVQNARTIIRQF